jgi:hypothetical protein
MLSALQSTILSMNIKWLINLLNYPSQLEYHLLIKGLLAKDSDFKLTMTNDKLLLQHYVMHTKWGRTIN